MSDRETYLARQRRYNASEKGRARWARYEKTEKGRERHARQIRMSAGGINMYVGVAPTRADAEYLRAKTAEFTARQRAEYREFAGGLGHEYRRLQTAPSATNQRPAVTGKKPSGAARDEHIG